MSLKLLDLSDQKSQEDTYQDPREKRIFSFSLQGLGESGEHFAFICRNSRGEVISDGYAHLIEGCTEKFKEAIRDFFLPFTNMGGVTQKDLAKDKAWLRKKAQEAMEKKS